jgi:hypothetical protein
MEAITHANAVRFQFQSLGIRTDKVPVIDADLHARGLRELKDTSKRHPPKPRHMATVDWNLWIA